MRRTALLTATALTAFAALTGSAEAVTLPSSDPFYAYTGSAPLASIPAGTVLKTRDVTLAAATNALPLPATQLLYRTADEAGKPTVTVTTVVVPATATVNPQIVGYLSFYDSLSPKCDPSYTLQGGDPGSANSELTGVEQALVQAYYTQGYVVTVPDFEGEGLHWTAGHEAGYGTLDALKATESFLKAPATTPVGLTGYSGGSIAADWASELAPSYAPDLDIVGVAEAGIPVDFAHNLTYINGSDVWSGIIAAVLAALSRAYGVDLPKYLSPLGTKLVATDSDECIGDFSGTTPGLKVAQLLKPQYQDLLAQPDFVTIINKLIMGTVPGHPKGPLLMEVGNDPNNAQGQGDDIMVTDDVAALAYEYCHQGVSLQYEVLSNSTHEQAALEFEPQASAFLAQRFAAPTAPLATDNCASVPKGNDISPIVLKKSSPPPAKSTPPRSSTTTRPAAAGRSLPTTGADPWVAAAGLLLLLTAGGAWRFRRNV